MAKELGMDLDEEEVLATLHAAFQAYPELWRTASASPFDGVDADLAGRGVSAVTSTNVIAFAKAVAA